MKNSVATFYDLIYKLQNKRDDFMLFCVILHSFVLGLHAHNVLQKLGINRRNLVVMEVKITKFF